jgi:hypothetical protein
MNGQQIVVANYVSIDYGIWQHSNKCSFIHHNILALAVCRISMNAHFRIIVHRN